MVKSKFKVFSAIGFIVLLLFASVALIIVFLSGNSGEYHPDKTPVGFYVFFLTATSFMLLVEIVRNFYSIKITDDEIQFKHVVFQMKKRFKLSELDGYADRIQHSVRGRNRVLYIKKNKMKVGRISSFYYENFEELRYELEIRIDYLGKDIFVL